MAQITLGGNAINTSGNIPANGSQAPNFNLTTVDMTAANLDSYAGKRKILNIFPSVDTGVCATSVRTFNQHAASLDNSVVLCISRDLPFAQKRFCGAEGISNVVMLSDFIDGSFGKNYGVEIIDGKFTGLHARAIVVLDENNKVLHSELVSEIAHEPSYDAALSVL
ncbi:MAG: thiol peroxidase [Chitinophagales bacterium]|nr:thiol peroxidase [Chitinophagales bacterium]